MNLEKRLEKIEQTIAPADEQQKIVVRYITAKDGGPDTGVPDKLVTYEDGGLVVWLTEKDAAVL